MKNILLLVYFILNSFSYGQNKVELTSFLPQNFVKDGSIDYTKYLQKGLNENNNVLMPNFPVLINKDGLNLKSNQTITFQQNSCLIMKPNSETNYGMLNIVNIENVKVYNAYLVGDKDSHIGKNGEWGMGINILSSSNVDIINPNINKTWGDGIYVGELRNKNNLDKELFTNNNINIKGGIINDCLRNGISIISGINIVIDGVKIKNISTKSPRAAIDIEPNTRSNIIRDITINNIKTENNFNGIVIMLTNLIDTKPIDIGTISINNHTDYDSNASIVVSSNPKNKKDLKDLTSLQGELILTNLKYFNSKKGFDFNFNSTLNPKLKLFNFNFYKTINNKIVVDNVKKITLTQKINAN
ncbi:hypothetical protein [Empedobacter tilapiae]